MASEQELVQFVQRIARGAAVIVRRHPGCGAIASLVHALNTSPVPIGNVDLAPHDEDANVEAYAEVRRLTAEVAELRGRITELEQCPRGGDTTGQTPAIPDELRRACFTIARETWERMRLASVTGIDAEYEQAAVDLIVGKVLDEVAAALAGRTVVEPAYIRAELAREVLAELTEDLCAFWACEGPDKPFVLMKTCRTCKVIQDMRAVVAVAESGQGGESDD